MLWQAYLQFNGWKADVIGFMGRVKNKSADSIKITYTLDDGTEVQDHKVSRPQMVKLPVPGAPGLEIEEAFDAVRPADQPQLGWRQNLEAFLYRFAVKKRLHRGGFWIILVAFVFCIYRGLYRNERLWRLYTVFCTLIGLCWLARVLLYTLIDARAWPGAQTRYLAPANAFGIVLFCVAIGAIASLIRRPSKPRPSDPMRGLHQNAVAI